MKKILLMPTDSIDEALANFPDNEPLELVLAPGIYRQKVTIKRDNVLFRGLEPKTTTIVYDDLSSEKETLSPFKTATLTITGHHVVLENLNIENDAILKDTTQQGLALALYGDETILDNCFLKSHGETLFVGPLPLDLSPLDKTLKSTQGRHLIVNTRIEGSKKLVFGCGNVLFKNCQLHANHDGSYVAPGHFDKDDLGFILDHCKLTSEKGKTLYLATPWRNHGKVNFIECQFGPLEKDRYQTNGINHFYFYEAPYVENSLSKPLEQTQIKKLLDPKTWS